jgi:hypothetical protein
MIYLRETQPLEWNRIRIVTSRHRGAKPPSADPKVPFILKICGPNLFKKRQSIYRGTWNLLNKF